VRAISDVTKKKGLGDRKVFRAAINFLFIKQKRHVKNNTRLTEESQLNQTQEPTLKMGSMNEDSKGSLSGQRYVLFE
jgi:hypothetical protein